MQTPVARNLHILSSTRVTPRRPQQKRRMLGHLLREVIIVSEMAGVGSLGEKSGFYVALIFLPWAWLHTQHTHTCTYTMHTHFNV